MDDTFIPYEPDHALPPGAILQSALDYAGMSQRELAERMGRSPKTINEIIKGKAPVTPETALQLEAVLNVSAEFWLNLERFYQEGAARRARERQLGKEAPRARQYPYAELARLGQVPPTRNPVERAGNLLTFFGVASLSALDDLYAPILRHGGRGPRSAPALVAWFRMAEQQARAVETESYKAARLTAALGQMAQLAASSEADREARLAELCASCGVALAIAPPLRRANVRAATCWLTPAKAAVMLCRDGRGDATFQQTFLHALGHIVLHGKRQTYVDMIPPDDTPDEREADRWAADALSPPRGRRRQTLRTAASLPA